MILLLETLMDRDDLTESEAMDIINEMIDRVFDGEDPEDVLDDYDLEPDYVLDLIDYASDREDDIEYEYD